MVSEHRDVRGRRIRFDVDDEAAAEGSAAWAAHVRAGFARLGVDLSGHIGRGVAGLAVTPGAISATVDGEHRVCVGCRPLPDEAWDDVVAAIAADPWSAAALLSGRLPEAVAEQVLPDDPSGLPLDCTCADWAMPCAHVRAVCAAAADLVAEDPFVLTRWRGRDRAALLTALRARRDEPPAPDPHRFWVAGGPVPAIGTTPRTRPDALVDELPPLGEALRPDGVTDARDPLRELYRRLGGVDDPGAG